jgi:hypothetical protein
VLRARLPLWLTPTRLAFGQPPSPQGATRGRDKSRGSRSFSYAIAVPLAGRGEAPGGTIVIAARM